MLRSSRPVALGLAPPTIADRLAWLQWRLTLGFVESSLEDAAPFDSMPDDVFQLVIVACSSTIDSLPLFGLVKGLACSKALLQQLHRLQPLVALRLQGPLSAGCLPHLVRRTAAGSSLRRLRSAHGPWRVTLLYHGDLTGTVMEQARQGRVRSINQTSLPWSQIQIPMDHTTMATAVARRVVPELMGTGCSLLELVLVASVRPSILSSTWAATFGTAAVCSAVLRKLNISNCGLRGPLPELRLPALQELTLSCNEFKGDLKPLQSCTALVKLVLDNNQLTGSLEPLRGCSALQLLDVASNRLTGGLEPLRGCTALRWLYLNDNQMVHTNEDEMDGWMAIFNLSGVRWP